MSGAAGRTREQETRSDGTFAERYRAAFLRYLESGDEAHVTPAYELSREAVGGHLSLLELAEAHRRAVAQGVLPVRDPIRQALLAERAADFLRESLATFEIAHRGYLEVQEVARLEHEHARQLQSVAEVSVALNAALPVADVIELVTAEARHVLGGSAARAQLELPSSLQLREQLTAVSGNPPPRDAPAIPNVLRASLTGRRGLVVGEIEVFGVEETDAGAEAILVQLAQVASAALGNAQIYGLEREIAETLQRSLLPQRLPQVAGLDLDARYCAAGDGMVVGGDFYDVFRIEGVDTWGIAIGDVCGKGPDAAALTALVRYTLRAAALWEQRPERVMAMLNAAILDQRSDYRFCTALYGQLKLSPTGGRVDFVTAGHPLPLVRRAGGQVEAVGTHSTVLGVVPDPSLHTDTVELGPGDMLLLYTDGVTEVRKRGREVFGVDQLMALLREIGDVSAAKAAERVEDAVLNASDGPPRDDLAVVAIRIPRVA
ncbi:PP2C family protein-serine/threonine phosphatase [Conexibacter sp. CPCC 206217]|uniref:PP2C family protein-serine/threonine phosphatase n=1 Tax=Conexibacter sp. CPCC 206217 TaxID=3064574 RepID=UPI002718A5AD|nr:SpoIIE family protein phosphatase [Conexibacter sp. CPCC 206217]MDO8210499.1 SpoIIE family protein phosphatase [Conexibacter sp. CPCC 206217]